MIARRPTFTNLDEALDALKLKNEKLYIKTESFLNNYKVKVDSLQPEAQTFVKNVKFLSN